MTELKESFDIVAEEYERYRSGYDPQVITDIKSLATVGKDSVVCEIGAGTGQASVDFPSAVSKLVCVEPGFNLAERLKRNLSAYDNVEVLNTTFEAAKFAPESFHLVFAAQSFHWVDAAVRCSKISEVLKPGGWLAAFWKRCIPSGREPTYSETKLFQEYLPDYQPVSPKQYEVDVQSDLSEIVESKLFSGCKLLRYPSPKVKDTRSAEERAESFRTWSMVAALERKKQDQLVKRLTEIFRNEPINESDFETTLVIGRKGA